MEWFDKGSELKSKKCNLAQITTWILIYIYIYIYIKGCIAFHKEIVLLWAPFFNSIVVSISGNSNSTSSHKRREFYLIYVLPLMEEILTSLVMKKCMLKERFSNTRNTRRILQSKPSHFLMWKMHPRRAWLIIHLKNHKKRNIL